MDEASIIDGLKTVCKCKGIKKKIFLKHIDAGISTVEALQRMTGAGSGSCRGKQCTPRLQDLVQSSVPPSISSTS